MDYYSKYLKYKNKYLELKGGQGNCIPLETALKPILESKDTNCIKIENVKKINYNEICNLNKVNNTNLQEEINKTKLPVKANSSVKSNSPVKPDSPIKPISPVKPQQNLEVLSKSKSRKISKKVENLQQPPLPQTPARKSEEDVEIELYTPLKKGGESDNIWPLISNFYKKENKLGIRSKNKDNKLDFTIVSQNIGKIDEPILGRGTFTAVYKIKNAKDLNDNTEYILRIYERNLFISPLHFIYNDKIINERSFYKEYSYNVFYFGEMKISDKEFSFLKNERGENTDNYIFSNKDKNYNFDYIITKVYNIPKFDAVYNIINISNPKKFLFLYNNIIMLNKMYKNNDFHADYKIANVGWEDNEKMNVILVDYDDGTIQKANGSNSDLSIINGKVHTVYFSSTYIPEYIRNGDAGIKPIYTPEQFKMYSIGGLDEIIRFLNIKFSKKIIDLPINLQTKYIKFINTESLGSSLNLDNKNIDLIPTYDEMIKIIDHLKQFVKQSTD